MMRAFSWRCRASSCAACVPSADRFMSKGPTPSTSGVSGRPYLSSPRETEKQRTSAVMSAHGHRHARALTSRCRSTAFPPRARGSSRPPLSAPSSCSNSHAGAVFSGLKRLRIFGERRSPLEISRRREESRVRVSDSSIVMMVASRREMYMYSKKKKSALFYTRRKVAWHSLNHHHKVGDRRTLGESERAFREAPDGADATPTTTATPLPRGPS